MTVRMLLGPLICLCARAVADEVVEIRRYDAREATQAVAVDSTHFYAIANSVIARYDRASGKKVAEWQATEDMPLKHLNSGLVLDGRLYCAHSNYPNIPAASSLEIWDTETLRHVDTHSFGVYEGSLTWVDRYDGSWWAVFAHYSTKVNDNPLAKSHRWTSLIRFDDSWRRTGGWVFPDSVLDRFDPNSCSGGFWGPDDSIYCTGHDLGEIYQLKLPKAGSTLQLVKTWKAPITGQGIAMAPDGNSFFGISRPQRQVIEFRWSSDTTSSE